MLRFAADESLNNDIVRGLLRRAPSLDIVRIQDTEFSGADDPTVLAWAARERRILLTHDVATITKYAYDRIRADQPMPGVFEINRQVAVGWRLKIYSCWPKAVWKTNGKVRFCICRCVSVGNRQNPSIFPRPRCPTPRFPAILPPLTGY